MTRIEHHHPFSEVRIQDLNQLDRMQVIINNVTPVQKLRVINDDIVRLPYNAAVSSLAWVIGLEGKGLHWPTHLKLFSSSRKYLGVKVWIPQEVV